MGREENEELYGGLGKSDSAYWQTRRDARAGLARITHVGSNIRKAEPVKEIQVKRPSRMNSEAELRKAKKLIDIAEGLSSLPEVIYQDTDAKRRALEEMGYITLPNNGKRVSLDACDAITVGRAFYLEVFEARAYAKMMSKLR